MLKGVDASRKLDKDDYKEEINSLGLRLSEMQRTCKDENIPVIIIFEGWSAAGKGSRISSLISYLDPRGFEVFTIQKTTEDERFRPYMWRFWQRLPAKGRIHVFDRSWYQALMRGHFQNEAVLADPVYDINSFEKTVVDNGAVIIKLFLHVSRKEQKKRLYALADNPETAWRVSKADFKENNKYKKSLSRFEKLLDETNHDAAHWTIIEADDSRFADVKVYRTVLSAMENAVKIKRDKKAAQSDIKNTTSGENDSINTENTANTVNSNDESINENNTLNTNDQVNNGTKSSTDANPSVLGAVDLNKSIDRAEYSMRLKKAQSDLARLHNAMYKQRLPAAMVFEGWDAAGKGGAITRTVASLDPRGYKVAPYGAPNDIEKSHHYLWRFWNEVPKAGHLTVFDRSWYGRVMVERVEGFCTTEDWKRAFGEINDFEKQLVDSGIVLMKFWLHIDPDEQLKRFELRTNTPEKTWKITDEDWRNREKWNQYLEAVDEMLHRTSTEYAPWTIVEADDKLFARIKVIETARDRLESVLDI